MAGLNRKHDASPAARGGAFGTAGGGYSPPSRLGFTVSPPVLSGINVIVPMCGKSEDFAKAGYRFPKPLISLVGRPLLCWMLEWLKLAPDDTVFLAVPRQVETEHAIGRRLHDDFPGVDFRLVLLDFSTRGPAETLFAVLQHLSPQELERRTISLDCDTVYYADIMTQFRKLPPGVSATWYFDDTGAQAIYSYISLKRPPESSAGSSEEEGVSGEEAAGNLSFVDDVREKFAISCHANVGAYGFETGSLLKLHCEALVDHESQTSLPTTPFDAADARHKAFGAASSQAGAVLPSGKMLRTPPSPISVQVTPPAAAAAAGAPPTPSGQAGQAAGSEALTREAGGWYLSAVMRSMLHQGSLIAALQLTPGEDFVGLGTPLQLRSFLRSLQSGDSRLYGDRRMRFVFDLDGTLVTHPKRRGDYASVEPIEQNVALVRSLKAAGHYIIVWTSRESERHSGNVGAIVAAVGRQTLDTLDKLQIPYDELLFGKPHADLYIDDRAVNSLVDTEKEVGWVASESESVEGIVGGVAARAFNTVRPLDEKHVAKTGPCNVMRGELYWYRHIPTELSDLFPTPVEMSDSGAHMASIVMTKVNGVPFTHLLVNLCLTPSRLLRFLNALTRLHRCVASEAALQQPSASYAQNLPESAFYVNLRPKVAERLEKFRSLYRSFSVSEVGFNTQEFGTTILQALQRYESEDRAHRADYIHGDPVFSNALLTPEGGVCFLDMRGALGERLTTSGDLSYDLAKVYQSLCGYDFFLQGREVLPSAQRLLDQLQRVFWCHLTEHYPEVQPSDVRLIAASHFFSLVPLHEVRSRMRFCLRAANALIQQEGITWAVQP
eukprot:TRINITY_DN21091_c0_g1_i1.p1 TRINITY_DN21091_c0_g1~~TRINITY_DN21091_c0_g1_i1.p1  ORF type:complete len:835 (-),score=152.07 TRINITY_DN21091_c0_g1_i1:82-2586(-)